MSKARTLANLISDNSVLADGQIAVAEVTGAAPLASPTFSGNVTTTGSFIVGNASLNENDLESIDGITAGTVAASKAVVVNSNKDASGFRNISLTGTVDGRDIATDGTKLDGIAASANNYTHPNHSGEVTSTADGATVIADNVVDEANLKISNTPTNGYVLTAQSGNTGGLTWAEAASGADLFAENYVSGTKPDASSSTNGVAIGRDAISTGSKSIAIGTGRASGTHSIAMSIGNNTTSYGASNNTSIAIGYNAKSTNLYATAIGYGSHGNHSTGVAIGRQAVTTANNQVALNGTNQPVKISNVYTLPTADGTASGQVMTTNGSGVVSWAAASGGGATSINGLSDGFADSNSNLGLGDNSAFGNISTAYRNIALGWNTAGSITTGDDNVLLGRNVSSFLTTGTGNTAVGPSALPGSNLDKMTGNYNTAVGQSSANSIRAGDSGTFIGHNSNGASNADFQTAIGYNAVTGAAGATALTNSRAGGADSFAAAIENNTSTYGATGTNSVAIGKRAKCTNTGFAIGYQTQSTAAGATVLGFGSIGSGSGATALGNYAKASGSRSIAIGAEPSGYYTEASGTNSVAIGNRALSAITGKLAYTGKVFSDNGDAQQGTFVLLSDTTDATAEALTTNKSTAGTTNQINLANNSAYTFSGTIVAREKASEGTDVGAWEVKGIIRREANAGTTVLVNSVINEFNAPTGWAVALTADTTNGCLKVEATGVASTNIRWVATIQTSEVTYA